MILNEKSIYPSRVTIEHLFETFLSVVTWFFAQWSWGVIVFLWLIFVFALDLTTSTSPLGLDAFNVYYQASQNLMNNTPIYNGLEGWIYLYPPLLAQLLMPVVWVGDIEFARVVWLGVNIGLLVVTLHILTRYISPIYHKALWLTPLLFIPIWQAFYLGQITILMLALLTGVWVASREGKPELAGALLAFSIWIKVFPALLLIYFLWKRDWRLLWGAVLYGGLMGLFQMFISGHEVMFAFLETLFDLFASGQPAATYENLSVFAFASRLFQPNLHVIPLADSDGLFRIVRIGLTLGLLLGAGYAIVQSSQHKDQDTWRFDLEYSLVILTILLIGSTLWISGLPPLILISVLLLRNVSAYGWKMLPCMVWMLAIFLLTAYQPFVVLWTLIGRPMGALTLSMGFMGVLLIWGTLVLLLLHHPMPDNHFRKG